MKTDAQLRDDVIQELLWNPRIDGKEIAVAVKDGVVTIAGVVPSYVQKYAAERAVERVSGVRAVADALLVKVPSTRGRTDTQIAHAAINALDWDEEVPSEGVKVQVENGWVRLDGTVEWQYQKAACERAVRYLTGVNGALVP
jgi:osmotically-inducible protein OsmY